MLETFLVKPLFNIFLLLYTYLPGHDFGVVVIVFTILVRLLLWPLFSRSIQSQLVMNELQPEIETIQKKYKDDKPQQASELMKIYKQHNFNPFSGILSLLVQLPILLAVYQVFRLLATPFDSLIYPWVMKPLNMNHTFFGLFDLLRPFIPATIMAVALQFFQVLFSFKAISNRSAKSGQSNPNLIASRTTAYLSPLLTFIIFRSFPSVLSLYWSVSSFVSLVQQWYVQRQLISKK